MDTDALVEFIAEAGKLKRLPRTGWVECEVPDPESVADHSFRAALIAMLLADLKGVDALKTVRMALIHDLAEAEIGDLTPKQKGADTRAAEEAEGLAMSRILNRLPEPLRGEYKSAWLEFSEGSTAEGRLARDADKLEMVMQASEYEGSGGDKGKLMRFWHAEIVGDEARAIRDEVRRRGRAS